MNVLDEVDSQELITELQKQYENEKLRNDNLQLKVDRTVFIFCGTVIFLIVAFCMCYYYYKSKITGRRLPKSNPRLEIMKRR